LFHSINGVLEQANLPLRPGEAIALAFILAIVIGLVAGAVTLNVFVGIGVAVTAILGVFAVINLLGSREKRKFEEQLPDTLTLLSTSLRAGYSLLQAVEAVATEAPQPTGREFGRAIAEIRLGRQVVDALEGVAERTRSGDFTWTVMAVEIQREVGGNLSEVLQTVADTMLQRNRLRREVRALTAEGRISAIVLGSMPFLLFLFLYTSNRNYIEPLFTQTVGRYAIIVGLILMGVGGFWMKKIVDIEI
ncbi:MAG: type II secretion system F family protein, partial [Acidimicrobiia bacterium]|nr:type II secretion system F family protein [Acidimicrobiia bacterium]